MVRNALHIMNRHIVIEELLPCLDDMDTEIMLMSGIGALSREESGALEDFLSRIRRFALDIETVSSEGRQVEEKMLSELDGMVRVLRADIDTAMMRRTA